MSYTNEARAAAKARLDQQLKTHRAETAIVASDQDIVDEFAALPLPVRMAAAADVLMAVNERNGNPSYGTWNPGTLHKQADLWEQEDRAKETDVEELAVDLYNITDDLALPACRDLARALLTVGWVKTKKESIE